MAAEYSGYAGTIRCSFLEENYLRTQYSDLLNQAIACVASKGLRLYWQRRLLICNRIDYIIVS